MANLGIPSNTIEILQKYDFNFRKQFGQNFLIDTRVLDKIVEASGICKDDCVLEIGPGIGTLTQYLAEKAAKVIAVEIDKNLIPILEDTLSAYDNITVLNQDILKTDIKSLTEKYNESKPIKVVANLPYYITSPIVMELLEGEAPIDTITVMVQKEVADRMCTGPGSKDYGALSLGVQYYSKPEIVAFVPQNCFIPRPKIGSSVIKLTKYRDKPVTTTNPELMFQLIKSSFTQRRKTLANGIMMGKNAGLNNLEIKTRKELEERLEQAGFPKDIRGEKLTLQEWAALTDLLVTVL